jgi:hypothetical protein
MKTRHPVIVPDDRTISVYMASGAVIRLRPNELVGWPVSDLKPNRRNLIELTEQANAATFKSSKRHRAQ